MPKKRDVVSEGEEDKKISSQVDDVDAYGERKELYEKITGDINERSDWESRQKLWYEMRHDGIPRKALPWTGAADLHHPLSDQKIEEQKPKYFSQMFSQSTVAFFNSEDESLSVALRSDEKKFDYKLKNKSNLMGEALRAIDYHLERGFCFVKVTHQKGKGIQFDAIEPLMCILPSYTTVDTETGEVITDRFVHVIQMPVWMYKQRKDFNQDEDFIKIITGGTDWLQNDSSQQQKTKEYREGFTGSSNEEEVILWEVWTKDGDKWGVQYLSPQDLTEPVKKKQANPYNHGMLPFKYLPREIKDKGVYSSRGIPEMVAAEEAVCNKILNDLMDRFTLSIRPIYVPTTPMPNTQNFDFAPGSISPFPLASLDTPPPPIDPLLLIQDSTARAERRIGVFDMSMGGSNNAAMGNEYPTKFQMQLVASQQGQSTDLKARVFRMFLTQLYKMAWELLCQYEGKEFQLSGKEFDIIPSGSPDGLTKEVMQQRAIGRMQMFANDPYFDQKRLREDVLENDDPRLIQKLMIEPENTQNDQAEEQAKEILLLEQLFPVMAKPTDDHKVHLTTMIQREQALSQMGVPMNQITFQRKAEHAITHLGMMKNQKDPEFKIYKNMVEQVFMPKQQPMQRNGVNGMAQPQQQGLPA